MTGTTISHRRMRGLDMFQKTYRLRMILLAVCAWARTGCSRRGCITCRSGRDGFTAIANDQHNRLVILKPLRGDISTATATPRSRWRSRISAHDHLRHEESPNPSPRLIREWPDTLGRSEARVRELWNEPGTKYVYRKADEKLSHAVQMIADKEKLKDFVRFERESKRDYPTAGWPATSSASPSPTTAATTSARRDRGNLQLLPERLGSKMSVQANNRATAVPLDRRRSRRLGRHGRATINSEIQNATETSARRSTRWGQGRQAIVMTWHGRDPGHGELPDFDLNDFARYGPRGARHAAHRALTDPYEIGSVMKIFTAAILLDKNLLSPGEMVNGWGVGSHPRPMIKDVHPLGSVRTRRLRRVEQRVHVQLSERLDPTFITTP